MWIAVVLIVTVAFAVLLWKVPKLQIARSGVKTAAKRLELENELRKTLAEIGGGLFLILGLYATYESLWLSRDTQVTERLTRAFGQLAGAELEERLGGIYSLERLAQDSERDHWTIIEVLTEVVRERASEERHLKDVEAHADSEEAWGLFAWPPPDVQAALTVIGRRSPRFRRREAERLDLPDVVFVGARLRNAHLERANLRRADFEGRTLAALSNGYFPKVTDLSGAHLGEALLDGAYFGRAVLKGARLDGASLRGADLSAVVGLTQAQLSSACIGPGTRVPRGLSRPKPCE